LLRPPEAGEAMTDKAEESKGSRGNLYKCYGMAVEKYLKLSVSKQLLWLHRIFIPLPANLSRIGVSFNDEGSFHISTHLELG
jgi:hypothetical protein